MINAFTDFISDNKLCNKDHNILVAVSGGVDSVVLLDLLASAGYRLAIAHCNFKLRGKESDGDEAFVRRLAKSYGLECFVQSFDTTKYAEENNLSVQEAARDLRYDWFEKLAAEHGFDRIALAHHNDDLVETFFINLVRGTGIRGLKGMPVRREKIIRPLLFAGKERIEAFASRRKLEFREDTSNTSDKYLRNRIRQRLIPEFRDIDPRSLTGLENSIAFLQEDNVLLNKLIDDKRKEMVIPGKAYHSIKINDLMTLQPVSTWSYYLLFPFGFNREVTDSIAVSSQKKESGKLFFSASHELLVDRDCLLIRDKKTSRPAKATLISASETEINHPLHLRFTLTEKEQLLIRSDDPGTAWFDFDKLRFPLKLRTWKKGDRFRPFGMQGHKLVSDYLTDEKVNLFDKENIQVLLSGNDIIWVVGYRSSEDYRVGADTGRVYRIEVSV